MYDLNHSPGAWRDGSCPVGKLQHGEVPVCTSQISHPWPSGCPSLSFSLGPHEGPAAFPTTQCLPAVFHVLQGQWEGGKRGKVFFLPSSPDTDVPLHPCHQPRRVPELSSAESCLEQKGSRGDAPAPGSVFTDSQNSLRNK